MTSGVWPWTWRPPPLRALAVLAVALAAVPVAAAQDGSATVRVDGRAVLRVAPADTLSAGARAARAERRVARLLEGPGALGAVRVVPGPGPDERTVSVPVVTATPADAEENLTTVDALAGQWAAALDAALDRAPDRRRTPWDRFAAEVQASVTGAFGRLLDSAITVVPRALAAPIKPVIRRLRARRSPGAEGPPGARAPACDLVERG